MGIVSQHRSEFVAVDELAFGTILAEFSGDHFYGHAYLDFVIINVGELSGDEWAFLKFNQSNSIRCVTFISFGRIVNRGVRKNFTFAGEHIRCFGFPGTVGTDVTRGKYFLFAVGTNFPN